MATQRRRGQRPEIGRAIGNLMTALRNRIAHEGWNEELLEEVVDILDEAAQRIERVKDAKERRRLSRAPPFDDALVDVHDGGVDLVPVHRLGESRVLPRHGWRAGPGRLVVGQLIGHGVDIAGLCQSPVTPSCTRLVAPDAAAARTGSPQAIASSVTLPNVSVTDGLRNTSVEASAVASSSPVNCPVKIASGSRSWK